MGVMDAFKAEDRLEVTFSTFYRLVRESAKAELLMNAINCDVPYGYIREMMTGRAEQEQNEVNDNGE